MKVFPAGCAFVRAAATAAAAALFLAPSAAAAGLKMGEAAARSTPVSRIVELLNGLQEKLESDLKAEEQVFQKFECWYKSVTDSKAASNTDASSRIASLQTYIQDIEAGKIEFTTERVDLEKQIAGLQSDLQLAGDLRSKESKDYDAAKAELQQGLAALTEAIRVLREASAGALAQTNARARWSLQKALQFGRETLGKQDVAFLHELLSKEVPVWDWKKLNRDATFKNKYAARSTNIIGTLEALKRTFATNLDEVDVKESQAVSAYTVLKSSKEGMLQTAQASLLALVKESGARGLSKSEAAAEVSALQAQVLADNAFIKQVQDAYDAKKVEWEAREALRQKELVAITQAISVLHSDEARDLFKKTFTPQGYLLIQEAHVVGAFSSRSHQHAAHKKRRFVLATRRHHGHGGGAFGPSHNRHGAAMTQYHVKRRMGLAQRRSHIGGNHSHALKALVALSGKSGDQRFAVLATLARATGIERVVQAIDSLVATLVAEATDDLSKKEDCEKELANSTREAQVLSRGLDDLTDDVARSEEKIAALLAQIKEQEELKAGLSESLTELERLRVDEAKQFAEDQATSAEAIKVIDQALMIITAMMQEVGGGNGGAAALLETGREAAPHHWHSQRSRRHASGRVGGNRKGGNRLAAVAQRRHLAHRKLQAVVEKTSNHRRQPFNVEAGQAPPPPPSTWENPAYTGSSGESAGILSILALVKEDVKKEKQLAITSENEAIGAFDKEKADIQASELAADQAISSYNLEKSTEEGKVVDWNIEHGTKKGELSSVMAQIDALKPGCDFFLVNFEVRVQKRNTEIDGLRNAKAVLQGASFS